MAKLLKATGPTVAVIHFNTERTSKMRVDEREHLAYHVARLLTGEATAVSEWTHFGISIECELDMDQGDG